MEIKEEDIDAFIGGIELAKDWGLGQEITEEEWELYGKLTEGQEDVGRHDT